MDGYINLIANAIDCNVIRINQIGSILPTCTLNGTNQLICNQPYAILPTSVVDSNATDSYCQTQNAIFQSKTKHIFQKILPNEGGVYRKIVVQTYLRR